MTNLSEDASTPASDIGIWFVDASRSGAALQAWDLRSKALDNQTKSRLEAIKSDNDRATRLAVHCALRVLVERQYGSRWRGKALHYSPAGRPSLPGLSLAFSLSHCDGAGLVAIGQNHDVGVDLEVRDRSVTMSPARQRAIVAMVECLPSLPERQGARIDLTFLAAWVRLEAYAKATGIGLGPLLTRALSGLRSAHHNNDAVDTTAENLTEQSANTAQIDGRQVKVCGLDVSPGFEAAFASSGLVAPPRLNMFPTTVSEIESFIGN